MFGTALRVIYRDARVLLVDDAGQRFIQAQVGGQGKNSGPRHHHLTRGNGVEFERVEQHLFLGGGELSGGARGGNDQLQFVWGVNRAVPDVVGADGAQDEDS